MDPDARRGPFLACSHHRNRRSRRDHLEFPLPHRHLGPFPQPIVPDPGMSGSPFLTGAMSLPTGTLAS